VRQLIEGATPGTDPITTLGKRGTFMCQTMELSDSRRARLQPVIQAPGTAKAPEQRDGAAIRTSGLVGLSLGHPHWRITHVLSNFSLRASSRRTQK